MERGIVQSSTHEKTKNSLKPRSCVKTDFGIFELLLGAKEMPWMQRAPGSAAPQQTALS